MSKLHLHPLLARRAEQQHGLVTTEDLVAAGIAQREVTRWVAAKRLAREAHGVYRMGGCPPSTKASILAAVLVHGSCTWASHRTAAWLWGLPGFGVPGRIELTRSVELSNERTSARVHRSTKVPDHHRCVVEAIPVTSLPRTLFDLGTQLGPVPLGRAVEAGLRSRHCTVAALYRVLEDLGGRGRPGTSNMRIVLAERGPAYVPTESELDLLGRAVVASIPGIEWQVSISDDRGYIRRVDGLHRRARVVIEWDGAAWHDPLAQQALDADGDRRLSALGLRVMRYRWPDVTQHPSEVRRELLGLVTDGAVAA